MKKIAQKIGNTYFPENTIPDTFERFLELYGNYPQYKDIENKEDVMLSDFLKLNPDGGQNLKSDKRPKKGSKAERDIREGI